MLPRCARNEPSQLLGADADLPGFISWPDKASALQSACTQPDARSVVDQYFEAIGTLVGEEVGAVNGLAAAKALHHAGKQAVDAASHVGALQAQPDVFDGDQAGLWSEP